MPRTNAFHVLFPTTDHPQLWRPLRDRMTGPGGFYNVGNALGLAGGVALAVAASGPTLSEGARAAWDHLAGSASALSITVAMLIFFWGGEAYHRAWANGFPPDARLNRWGDLLSAVGALALGLGLFLIGEALLAATAGLLHAAGKLGSALKGPDPAAPAARWPDPFRAAVVASRLPAIALVLLAIGGALAAPGSPAPAELAAPALLLVCYLLWMRADLLLLRS
ncbi:hypothetical protein [Amaricoccus sp.]|uniref:hypothetical protein n=1 Tax=Amaricoccus sp. TaxID=1872485 RepID=UPI001B4B2F56|nr:hypothetical protein [Amaricoccus sp.]MBP7240394.1 hypothetical protein [Amaricoccus sp.]